MADDKKQANQEQQTENNRGDIHGRIHNSQNPAFQQQAAHSDISNVDQQEGNMNNGECGDNQNTGTTQQ